MVSFCWANVRGIGFGTIGDWEKNDGMETGFGRDFDDWF
jgi:hypothetical protein